MKSYFTTFYLDRWIPVKKLVLTSQCGSHHHMHETKIVLNRQIQE